MKTGDGETHREFESHTLRQKGPPHPGWVFDGERKLTGSAGCVILMWVIEMGNRSIPFERIQNVRDLGGLQTADGRVIKSGLLIRSANLSEATDADVRKLENIYRLSMIVDLRTGKEKEEKPDALVPGAVYAPVPVFDERVAGISHERDQSTVQLPVMEKLYRMIVSTEACRRNLGKAAATVMEHDFSKGSVLWHCTEGKDRCGLLAAMLLAALGVDRAQIMEDYLLTNEVNGPKAQRYYRGMLAAGKTEQEAMAIKNAFLAKASYLEAAFFAIEEEYPNIRAYLTEGLGIPMKTILAFREKVLQ